MSKEREDFIAWYGSNPEQDEHGNYTGAFTQARWETWQAATAHYQPLLDAKNAEIAALREELENAQQEIEDDNEELASRNKTIVYEMEQVADLRKENTALKALLEQAREVINDLCDLLDGECEEDKSGNLSEDCAHVIAHLVVAEQCIDAINAATGEK